MDDSTVSKKITPYSCAESLGGIRIEKYRKSRYWSVWVEQELLAVTVYKKGAVAIRNILSCEVVSEIKCLNFGHRAQGKS